MLWAWGLGLTWWVVSAAAQFTFSDLAFMAKVAGVSPGSDAPDAPPTEGLVLWYRANDSNGLANGSTFTLWGDRSGLGNDLTNLSSGSPYLSNGVVNGKSAWVWTGGNRGFAVKQMPPITNAPEAAELFYVIKSTNSPSPGEGTLTRWMPGGTSLHPYHGSATALQQAFMAGAGGVYGWPIPAGRDLGQFHVLGVLAASNDQRITVNGELVGGQDWFVPVGATNFFLGYDGSSAFFKGAIAEVLLYTNRLGDEDRSVLHQYFANYYGLGQTNCLATYYPSNFANLWGWWDASAITGLTNGQGVATWVDLSGNGRDFTNAASTQPTWVSNVFNGKPAVRFSPASPAQFMQCQDWMTNGYNGEMWMIFVHRYTNAIGLFAGTGLDSFYQWRMAGDASGQNMIFFDGTVYGSGYNLVGSNVLRATCLSAQTNSGSATWQYRHWLNTTNSGGFTSVTTVPWGRIGATPNSGAYAQGDVCEIIWYQGHFDWHQWAKLFFTYLKPKWGLP